MLTRRVFLAAGAASLFSSQLPAAPFPAYDAVILTGIDNSGSQYYSKRIVPMFDALIEVLSNRSMLGLLTSGPTGRTMFGIYLWGHQPYWITAPVTLSRPEPLNGMGPVLRALSAFRHRIYAPKVYNNTAVSNEMAELGTNVEKAMEFGLHQFSQLPEGTKILNIVTDDDKDRDGNTFNLPDLKERAERMGVTVSALVQGQPDALDHYFEKYLRTRGGFVRNAEKYANMEEAWLAKFKADVSCLPGFAHA